MTVHIEPLASLSATELEALVTESERDGWRFVRRLLDEWSSGQNRFVQPGERLFGALSAGELIGIGGLSRDPYEADTRIGRVRRMYVLRHWRRCGVGRRLMEQIIETARETYGELRLRTESAEAARFYKGLGFQARREEPHFTHVLSLEDAAKD